jgi:hypothetical protein
LTREVKEIGESKRSIEEQNGDLTSHLNVKEKETNQLK